MQCDVSNIENLVKWVIERYKNNPGIVKVKETFEDNDIVSFGMGFLDTSFKEIVSLDSNKATPSNDVPTKIVRANYNLFAVYLSKSPNEGEIKDSQIQL